MNYYMKIGELNNKNGYLSLLTTIFGVATIVLIFVETFIYGIALILFIISLVMVILNKKKLKNLQREVFMEFLPYMVSVTNQEFVNGIDINTFFSAKGTANDKKMMAIYDEKLELDNTQYIDLLLAAKQIGFDDVEFDEIIKDGFDINSYVLKKISDVNQNNKDVK